MKIARIAVEKTLYSFDRAFDYCIPIKYEDQARPGCRVLVPFGASNSKRMGMILEQFETESSDAIKEIQAVLDPAPLLTEELLSLVPWIKGRYFCTLFDAVKLLLPSGIMYQIRYSYGIGKLPPEGRLSPEELRLVSYLSQRKEPVEREKLLKALEMEEEPPFLEKLVKEGILRKSGSAVRKVGDATQKMVRLSGRETEAKLTLKQKKVVELLEETGTASLKEICYYSGVTPAVIQNLLSKGIVSCFDAEIYRNPYERVPEREEAELTLSLEQERVYENILSCYREKKGAVSLLYGVTGSGKTSVFMKLIDQIAAEGRGVIVMVPEIALTPQTIGIFHRRYGAKVAVFHSALSLGERLDEWKRVKSGEALIAVGTRSAVFAPFRDIGLIVMDEEQEYTYKSESSPRYHARDVAKFRCAYHKGLLLLSSATPSLETYYNALEGRYQYNKLGGRYGKARLPRVSVIDMNEELEAGNDSVISRPLYLALRQNLEDGRQSILLLNRRGYNTFVSCRSCGYVASCPNCSISLTYHAANGRLMCHYCGYSVPFEKECPQCHEERMHCAGFGTQRAEDQLKALLPEARVLRMDADTAFTKDAYEKNLEDFSKGKYDMIVGTQMVAKGLDFENVTLVGVLSADQTLYSDDFRSYERAFSLLTQVVGRSGRGRYEGRAVIQTFTPENEIFQLAARQDYEGFYDGEILLRKAMLYPPFSDICVVGFVGAKEELVRDASRLFLQHFGELARREYAAVPLRVLQPAPAFVPKVNKKYRYKLIVKCRNTTRFREFLGRLLQGFAAERRFSSVTVFADINPDTVL